MKMTPYALTLQKTIGSVLRRERRRHRHALRSVRARLAERGIEVSTASLHRYESGSSAIPGALLLVLLDLYKVPPIGVLGELRVVSRVLLKSRMAHSGRAESYVREWSV